MSNNIFVDEQEAYLIAQMQYQRVASSPLASEIIAPEQSWVETCAAEIMKYGCHPDELKRINDDGQEPQDVEVYSNGIVACSVCAPASMKRNDVEAEVNRKHPACTPDSDLRWSIAEDEFFKDGTTPNGGIVDCHRGKTRHWLLHC